MKYYIISGEASGDLHASNLAKQLFIVDKEAEIRAWGGDLLRNQGANVVKDYKDLAFMGFVEVAMNLRTIFNNLDFCKQDITDYQPDVVVLVDYPGFNLRMAKFLNKQKIRTFYYISPQVWAWHRSRVKSIKKYVDEMFVILPFEKDFYAKYQMKVHYLGHPLLDAVKTTTISLDFRQKHNLDDKPIIAILPGSRRQEILRMLPVMQEVSSKIDGYQFVIAGVEHHRDLYTSLLRNFDLKNSDIKIVFEQTYNLLENAHAAMVTSGTATLETALFNVPQVVCYKGNYLSYLIAKNLIKGINYISLVNLIADKEVAKELIQNEMNANKLLHELQLLLGDTPRRTNMLEDYKLIQQKLGDGNASKRIAEVMHLLLSYDESALLAKSIE
jgi:lipid-A-disaccharide synthase